MASAPSDRPPILGRVDTDGRLVAADPELDRLQVEAGSRIGASLALPQLAAVVRVAQRLRIPVSRRILAAGRDQDVDMWVRATPEGDEVALAIEQWSSRPASPQRLSAVLTIGDEALTGSPLTWTVDEQLRLVTVAPALAEHLSLDPADAAGQALTKLFKLEENGEGEMPLLAALASRSGFSGQPVVPRGSGPKLVLSGEAVSGADGAFAGFEGTAALAEEDPARPPVDSAIHLALRSPLDSIVRSAEDMVDSPAPDVREEYAEYAADIAAAARHLLSVVRSLGDKSDVPSGDHVDLGALAMEAIALLETAAREREIVIGLERADSFHARGETRSVVQILVNLIGNAVRYSAEGTAVTVSFEASG